KDPVLRTRQPTLPPGNRSREAQGLTAMAAVGRFALQICTACGQVQYPPRQVCGNCLGDDLPWREVDPGGSLLAETKLHHANDLYFRDHLPWRLGVVKMDAGPSVVVHLAEDCQQGMRVRLSLNLDRSGHAVMNARPEAPGPNSEDDLQLRELTMDPKDRRVLIVDGKTNLGLGLAQGFAAAGAREIFVGHAEPWKASAPLNAIKAIARVTLFPLDVTDTDSVQELAAVLGGKVEIMVNNSYHLRPGGAVDRLDMNISREEMDIHYFGLLRLAGTFGPAMRARGADGAHGACAWVNILSAYAQVNNPAFGTYSASQAAALSLAQCLRAELSPGGVRVVNAFIGPLDDDWHQMVPPPKLGVEMVAGRIIDAMKSGREDLAIGAVAEEIAERLAENPKEIEREIKL
ncbi:MAG: SDR family NAD(P)-dependent oxidoreductase, partial [Rhodospirillaceae bacterium]|nr:SDR family NAD(P)-dependent oxidoreductase [Rhodospirillaceae bacterium]